MDLTVAAGERVAVVGPSGAGKTTLLRAVAGFDPLAAGRVALDGADLRTLPPHRRPIATMFQDPRLFPHLDAGENVTFALRAAGVRRAERRAREDALLREVGLDGFARRPVAGLSGGEAQRVALARALCARPRVLLLDEPLAALDPDLRRGVRDLVLRLQRERGVTCLLVTHDRAEAAETGDRIAVVLDGRLAQCGPPREVFTRPADAATARFVGCVNTASGPVRDGVLVTGAGDLAVGGPDGAARVVLRPEHVVLDPGGPLRMTVREAVFTGSDVRLRLVAPGLDWEAHAPAASAPPAGAVVGVRVEPDTIHRLGEAAADHRPAPVVPA